MKNRKYWITNNFFSIFKPRVSTETRRDKLSKAEKQEVENIMLTEAHMYNFTSYAKEQGFEEGRLLEKIEIVDAMLTKQCDWDFISSVCGITEQEYSKQKGLE